MSQKMSNKSAIDESFKDKSVLITGATGLVGKLILYKILHSVESVRNVYILMRSKKGKSVTQRFNDMMSKSYSLFENIEKKSLTKLFPIEGDITAHGLGLKETDRNKIINNVSIVFHSAADVTFDTSLREQLITNVVGVRSVIELCRELKKLDVFVHVSTTYSNPLEMVTEEKVYETTAHALDILEHINDPKFNFNAKELIGNFPNTYTFTKNLAENLVKCEYKKGALPTTIVRPGIVSTSIREPFCGWFDSITSIAGGFLLLGSGIARTTLANMDITADAIPVDIVANTCIAAAWNTMTNYKSELRVYNCNTSCLGAPVVRHFQDIALDFFEVYPIWNTVRPISNLKSSWIPIFLIQFFSETCVAYFFDFLLFLIGQKRIVVRFVKTYQHLMKACECFVTRQWYYTNNNFAKLSEELVGIDKTTFNCDARGIKWIKYMTESYFKNRKLLLKETDEHVHMAQKRYKLIKTGYTILNHLLMYFLLKLLLAHTPLDSMIISFINFIGFNSIQFSLGQIGFNILFMSALFNIAFHFISKKNSHPHSISAHAYAEKLLNKVDKK